LVCRNYDDIDKLALQLTLQDTPIDGGEGMTMAQYLEVPCENARSAGKAFDAAERPITEATKLCKSRNEDHINAATTYNEVVAALDTANKEHALAQAKDQNSQDTRNKLAKVTSLESQLSEAAKKVEHAEKGYTEAKQKLAAAERDREDRRRGLESAEAIAEAAVRKVAQSLLRRCPFEPTDQISRARFFFTWIGTCIRYSKQVFDLNYYRHAIVTLTNGYEVCEGYAKLFAVMFNTDSTGKLTGLSARCEVIRGHAKQGPEDILPKEDRHERGHAWIAFPIPRTGGPPQMKVRKLRTCNFMLTNTDYRPYMGRRRRQ
jgi:transglutaminase/protease-like cytokinesis protein 3